MRITGGQFGGLLLNAPKGDAVRPTQDRVREALFSMLQEAVPGSRFLDLYAGSGSVGLEALSRGAAEVAWVEADRAVARTAADNIRRIAGERHAGRLAVSDAGRWLRTAARGQSFDIVFADPPYEAARADGLASLAARLADAGIVAGNGIFVAEVPVDAHVAPAEGWGVVRDRIYGKTRIVIRQKGLAQ